MTIKYETTLKDFDFWGNAHENVSKLTDDELYMLEEYFDDTGAPFGRTELNDLFAYDFENICGILGYTEEEVQAR